MTYYIIYRELPDATDPVYGEKEKPKPESPKDGKKTLITKLGESLI